MYGEFERDLIAELQQMNRKLDQMTCFVAMINSNLDESKECVKNEVEKDVKFNT